jgi:hypothetical protein
MLNIEKYEKLLGSGLGLDHYYILVLLYNHHPLPQHKRVEGFINLLAKKGYIAEGILTAEALDLVQDEIFNVTLVSPTTTTTTLAASQLEYNDWVAELHLKLQEKLVELTGKKQVRDKIKGGSSFSFLCNQLDLGKNLRKVVQLYKLKDSDRPLIEKTLFHHMESCNKAQSWFPLVYYYIFKDGKSQLVTDMEGALEVSEDHNFNSEVIL